MNKWVVTYRYNGMVTNEYFETYQAAVVLWGYLMSRKLQPSIHEIGFD